MKIVGTMFIEVNRGDYHNVVEIAMVETEDGMVQPGGVRDALLMGEPEVLPEAEEVQAAIELAKWCYLNQSVFEGRTSDVPVAKWDIAADMCINDALREEPDEFDPESN